MRFVSRLDQPASSSLSFIYLRLFCCCCFSFFGADSGHAFSKSSSEERLVLGRVRRLLLDSPICFLTEDGNSDLRGVMTVLIFLAERRIVSFIVHSRFLAMKKRVAVAAETMLVVLWETICMGGSLPPMRATRTTTIIIAIMAPVERLIELAELSPEAPISVPLCDDDDPSKPFACSVAKGT